MKQGLKEKEKSGKKEVSKGMERKRNTSGKGGRASTSNSVGAIIL